MASTPMDIDAPGSSTPNGNLLQVSRAPGGSTSQLSEVISTFRPTKLFRREHLKEGQAKPHVLSLDFDDPGELLMTSESDETIQIYNVKEGVHNKTLMSKKYGVKLAKFTHTSSSIIYASTKQNDAIRYLATHDNSFIRYFEGHEGRVTCIATHPGNDNFISCSQDNTVRLWNVSSKQWVGQLFLNSPYLAAYDPSGNVFAVASPTAGSVLLYDCKNFDKAPFSVFDVVEQCRGVGDAEHLMKGWTKLEFSNDGKSLLVGTRGAGHFLLDAFDGTLKAYLRKPEGGTSRLAPGENPTVSNGSSRGGGATYESSGECCFTPDGRFVISGTKKGVIGWDVNSTAAPGVTDNLKVKDPSFTLEDKREAAVLAFNPRYNHFATADEDVVFWVPDQGY
ncbi:related to histone methyltransferase [Cephalotrichum gorgonifer]|uniref:Related to histone methyltransferase n=1 Tax=Cephalotrichum gorgonifer TaxID=2041049 RepID=A0AAE8MV05_9PEZI|nr:related to histone methyltransferase [Cephalotrichum gorgonifer]